MLNLRRPIEVVRTVVVSDTRQRKLVTLQVVNLRLAGMHFNERQHLQITCVLPGEIQCYAWVGGDAAAQLYAELDAKTDDGKIDHLFMLDTNREMSKAVVAIELADGTFEQVFACESDLRAQR